MSNNIQIWKIHLECAFDGTFAVAYYDLAVECQFCKALRFDCKKIGTKSSYHFRSCCHVKMVILFQTRSYPLLEKLLKNKKTSKHHCLENIQKYNSAISRKSFVDNEAIQPNERANYLFKINGLVCSKFGPFYPENGKKRSHMQFYIINTIKATYFHISKNFTCDANLMAKLHEMILEVNPLTQKYRMMSKVERTENELAHCTA